MCLFELSVMNRLDSPGVAGKNDVTSNPSIQLQQNTHSLTRTLHTDRVIYYTYRAWKSKTPHQKKRGKT